MTPEGLTLGTEFDRLQRNSLAAGIVALIVCVAGAFFNPQQFFRSYLMAYLFWSGVTLGCFAMVMLHHMVGGGWGFIVRRLLEAGTKTIALVAVMVVPILLGVTYLYLWTDPQAVAKSEALLHKRIYLNSAAFVLRTIFYFLVWFLMAHYLNKWSAEQDESADLSVIRRLQTLSGPGLILYGFTVTFASVDWIMSLEPEFFSTIYSAMFMMGQVLSCLALVIALAALLASRPQFSSLMAPKYLNDLGNILLTFLILWAYMQFSQLLIVWTGNLTDEIPWYLRRTRGGWWVIAWAVVLFHFFVPLALLLSRQIKRRIRWMAKFAVALLVVRLFEMFWMVDPAFDSAVRFHWMDWLLPVGLGGIWMAWFVRNLRRMPLFPLRDPRLEAAFVRIDQRRVGDVE
jgi:hypothetical protein